MVAKAMVAGALAAPNIQTPWRKSRANPGGRGKQLKQKEKVDLV
jgi:hypothetical protein